MQILNISGYKFTPLSELESLRDHFHHLCNHLQLKGTILLSTEGMNLSLSGKIEAVHFFKNKLHTDHRFKDFKVHENISNRYSFKRLKVKIKNEIITLRNPKLKPSCNRAPAILPETFKQWLDEKRNITILDARNTHEIEFGTFVDATHLGIHTFCEFPNAIQHMDRKKIIVTFCTGGIRCEKAALYMIDQGFENVFQLEGGILNYFNKIGSAHYQGGCFVFDERVVISPP